MKIFRVVVGPLQSNCYIVYDGNSLDGAVIDPGGEPSRIIDIIEQKKLRVHYIVCTHAHFDHVGGVSMIKERTGASIVIHKDDREPYAGAADQAAFWGIEMARQPEPDIFVSEGDELPVGSLRFRVLSTPGHSPGSICLYGEGIVLTGDTVFAGSVGRTDFPGGDIEELKKSFIKIMALPPETKILPGHGESSTVKNERESNFFVQEL
jgi:hydroxyacylglutathione hydrolase